MVPLICVEASSGIIFISRVYLLVEGRKRKYSLYNGGALVPHSWGIDATHSWVVRVTHEWVPETTYGWGM